MQAGHQAGGEEERGPCLEGTVRLGRTRHRRQEVLGSACGLASVQPSRRGRWESFLELDGGEGPGRPSVEERQRPGPWEL